MKNILYIHIILIFLIAGCSKEDLAPVDLNDNDEHAGGDETIIPLKTLFEDFFPIGAAVMPNDLTDNSLHSMTLKKHFSSLTAENNMKPDALQREKGVFTWEGADRIVSFARANGMKVRGHCLTWHAQSPNWMFYDDNGDLLSKEVALKQLEEHITTVVSRYKGLVYAWDVVNEAMFDWDPDGTIIYREDSPWYQICGESYIDSAFVYAHRADPEAKLFYNDYNEIFGWKRYKIYGLVKRLKDNGIPIHGLGMQGHWNVETSETLIRESLDLYKTLGVEIQITELDVSVYSSDTDQSSEVYTQEFSAKQKDAYKMLFNIIDDYKDIISGITFWGIGDDKTWLDRPGRKAFPFLLDEFHQPKPAYYEVQKIFQSLTGS